MNFEKKINQKIIELWNEFFINEHNTLQPLFYPTLKRHSLLFVGCNPSLNEVGLKTVFKNTEHESLNFQDFYLWKNRDEEKLEMAINFAKDAKLKHNYFKKFREISRELELDWEHIDLFFVHETDQKKLRNVKKITCKSYDFRLWTSKMTNSIA